LPDACDHPLYYISYNYERITMVTTIEYHRESDSMMPLGWITITHEPNEGTIVYGVFDTQGEALSHGEKLINAKIVRIYAPTIH